MVRSHSIQQQFSLHKFRTELWYVDPLRVRSLQFSIIWIFSYRIQTDQIMLARTNIPLKDHKKVWESRKLHSKPFYYFFSRWLPLTFLWLWCYSLYTFFFFWTKFWTILCIKRTCNWALLAGIKIVYKDLTPKSRKRNDARDICRNISTLFWRYREQYFYSFTSER